MAKTSRQQKKIQEYEDTPLKPDFSKSGDEFVEDLLKQLPLPPIPLEEKQHKD